MRVCHLTTVHKPGDVRIYHKECRSLVNNGYEVSLIAIRDDKFKPDGIEYIPVSNRNNRFFRIIISPLELFVKTFRTRAKLFHFHDPELIPVGILLRLFGKKVIYDVHENYSGQIVTKQWLGNKIIRKLVSLFFQMFEKIASLFFNGVITVTPEIAEIFQKNKTVIISNYPILSTIENYETCDEKKKKPVILYSGGIDRIRGIKEIIQSMEMIKGDAELLLMGPWESIEFKKECQNLNGWVKVVDKGIIPFGEHYKYMKMADLGIINFYPLPNHVNALPNKPFEYMACSLPIIMSDFPKWKNYFSEVALFADPMDPAEIAKCIDDYLSDNTNMVSIGKLAHEIVMEKYSWESEQNKLLAFYKKILKV